MIRQNFTWMQTGLLALAAAVFILMPLTQPADAQESNDQGEFDKVIEVGVKPGQMRYDVEEFTVPAGGRIKLIFDNSNGTLQHNLLILVPGDEDSAVQLAQEAWSMQDPINNDYVPDSDDVLFHTSLLSPGETETITFQAPDSPGDHPYVCTMPGHAMTMNGMMHVKGSDGGSNASTSDKPSSDTAVKEGVSITDLSYSYYEGNWDSLPNFDEVEPVKEGTLSGGKLTLKPRKRDKQFAMVFEGTLHASKSGTYKFFQRSDDGSKLIIDGKTVIDHDGLHSATIALKTISLEKGTHSYRVEYFQKPGNLALQQSVVGPDGTRYFLSEEKLDKTLDHILSPEDKPLVVRALLPDVPTRSLAVGLPGGPHYVFDTVNGVVRYGWSGQFLNVGPLRGNGEGRGGNTVNIPGERFEVGTTAEQPLRFTDPDSVPDVTFRGYELNGDAPVLMFELNGIPVRHTVTGTEEGHGLRLSYSFKKTPEKPVYFRINRENVDVSSPSGTWTDDTTLKFEGLKTISVVIHSG